MYSDSKIQLEQPPRRLRLSCRRQQLPVLSAGSAELPRNLANAAVALAGALGSSTAEKQAMKSSITHGERASRLAKVGCREAELGDVPCWYDATDPIVWALFKLGVLAVCIDSNDQGCYE